jgi:hypothetical protein
MLILDNRAIFNPETDKTQVLLVVIEASIYPSILTSIDQYKSDLILQDCTAIVTVWGGGTAAQLRELLSNSRKTDNIDGAFLVGNLPAAWYESNCFSNYQDFPTDLFLADFKALWTDSDGNGVFDSHTALHAEIFTSRLIGNADQLNRYFAKVHEYRQGRLGTGAGAYIFKDDAWENIRIGNTYGMEKIYSSVLMRDKQAFTTKTQYMSDLADRGADYVFQWIHAAPTSLFVDERGTSNDIDIREISETHFKALFYNLFDCSASRFTQDNLATAYLLGSGSAIATLGSTKTGGNYYPYAFNYVLQNQGTWGDAFKFWYNDYGVTDDCWFLGMTILGDPALVLSSQKSRTILFDFEASEKPAKKEIDSLNTLFDNIGPVQGEQDYKAYLLNTSR